MCKHPILIVFFTLFFIASCSQTGLDLVIQFDDVDGLSSQSMLIHETQAIGEVTKIEYMDSGTFDVYVHVDDQYKILVNQSSQFYIDRFADVEPGQAVYILPGNEKSEPLHSGDRVQGSTRFAAYTNKLKKNVDETLTSMKQAFNQTVDEISQSGLEQQVTTLDQEIDELVRDMDSFSAQTKRLVKQEVIPELKQQTRKLRMKMDDIELDETMDAIEEKLTQLTEALGK